MASADTIPCSCCDGEATHRGEDGFYRCERHRLTADLAPFEVAVVESLRAQLAEMTETRDALIEESNGVVNALGRWKPVDDSNEAMVNALVSQLAAANAQRDELLRDISVALQMLREASDRSAKPDEKRGLCTSAFCNGNHHDSSCEGDYMTSRWLESMSEAIARAQSGQPPCNGPVGINGQRDPDHPCDMFRNGEPSERNTCDGDGHYLCNECGHYRCDPPEQSGQPAQRDDDLSKHDDHCNCERCR